MFCDVGWRQLAGPQFLQDVGYAAPSHSSSFHDLVVAVPCDPVPTNVQARLHSDSIHRANLLQCHVQGLLAHSQPGCSPTLSGHADRPKKTALNATCTPVGPGARQRLNGYWTAGGQSQRRGERRRTAQRERAQEDRRPQVGEAVPSPNICTKPPREVAGGSPPSTICTEPPS